MRYETLLLALLCLMSGCSTIESLTDPQELLAYRISVPRQHAWGKSNPFLDSSHDRYVRAYDRAWWMYIEDMSHNMDDLRSADFHLENGGISDPSVVAGFRDGFAAAKTRVHSLITRHGKQRTQALLEQTMVEILKHNRKLLPRALQ